jgi:hypothetical protein
MTKEEIYELKKIYYEILAKDPDYPAWEDFEFLNNIGTCNQECARFTDMIHDWELFPIRYNPKPKKWEPKDGWHPASVEISSEFMVDDFIKLQAYATKLSWLREQGGYKFIDVEENFRTYTDDMGNNCVATDYDYPEHDAIYMSGEQVDKWLKMLRNGEV